MCIRFQVSKIVVTTAPANMVMHDGETTVNPDCPVGTVLAYDLEDNVYTATYDVIAGHFVDASKRRPAKRKREIELFRDYWRVIQSGPDTPYGASFRNAPHKVVELI